MNSDADSEDNTQPLVSVDASMHTATQVSSPTDVLPSMCRPPSVELGLPTLNVNCDFRDDSTSEKVKDVDCVEEMDDIADLQSSHHRRDDDGVKTGFKADDSDGASDASTVIAENLRENRDVDNGTDQAVGDTNNTDGVVGDTNNTNGAVGDTNNTDGAVGDTNNTDGAVRNAASENVDANKSRESKHKKELTKKLLIKIPKCTSGSKRSSRGGNGDRGSAPGIEATSNSSQTRSSKRLRSQVQTIPKNTTPVNRSIRDRKSTSLPMIQCPICGVHLSSSQIDAHLLLETSRLDTNKPVHSFDNMLSNVVYSHSKRLKKRDKSIKDKDKVYETEQYIEATERLKAQSLSNTRSKEYDEIVLRRKRRMFEQYQPVQQCPVCNTTFEGDNEQLVRHVNQCLLNTENLPSDDEIVDIEGDVYQIGDDDWRVRASSLLEGGQNQRGQSSTTAANQDEEVDIEDNSDSNSYYGDTQYNENDMIAYDSDDNDTKRLRLAVFGEGNNADNASLDSTNDVCMSTPGGQLVNGCGENSSSSANGESADIEMSVDDKTEEIMEKEENDIKESNKLLLLNRGSMVGIINSLKNRIRKIEERSKETPVICNICMDSYTVPLVSTVCWHVHCESCWLQSLATKKLCPQCNVITSAANLRKVYM